MAAVVLFGVSGARGQGVKLEIGGADQIAWLKRTPTKPDDLRAILDMADRVDLLGKAAQRHMARSEYRQARGKYEEMLKEVREVFVEDSPMVAMMYGAIAVAVYKDGDLPAALDYNRLYYECSKRTFPPSTTFPGGRECLAKAANNYGTLLVSREKWAEGEKVLLEALQVRRDLYKTEPDNPDVIDTLGNLAELYFHRKSLDDAEKYAAEALERSARLCGTPDGLRDHRDQLARCKNNMAEVLRARGRTADALTLQKEAVELSRGASASSPDDLALRKRNEAMGHLDLKEYDTALRKLREVQAAVEQTFPPGDYPNGHPELLRNRRDIAVCLDLSGKSEEAKPVHREAVEMALRLYPSERFPDGHTDLAYALTNFGSNCLRRGDPDEAARTFRFALDMWLSHIDRQAGSMAETDVLSLLDSVPGVLNGLLVAGADRPFDDRDYRYVWASKAGVMRVLEARRRGELARGNAATKLLADRLAEVRAKLSVELTRGGADAAPLTRERDDLERKLANELKLPPPPRTHPAALQAKLPANAAFVDFWKYRHPHATAARDEAEYVAFVVTPVAVVRVKLGAADAIDRAAAEWLRLIEDGGDEIDERRAAEKVAELVWKPLSDHIPGGTARLFLSPDADLARLPFAALPVSRTEMLLDRFEPVSVPHGPFLLDLLKRETASPPPNTDSPLVVGGVDYGDPKAPWPALPFTAVERTAVVDALSAARPVTLMGNEATVRRVLAELPKAGAAHFATHAVFDKATPDTAGFTLIDRRYVRPSVEYATPLFAKSPLALTALVLAGANRFADRSDGYLSGEAVAGLRLEKLRFVVLSACESVRGLTARGEGVFGFQRAFHVAGCPCVVGSLWKVNDPATAALMRRFYTHLNAARSNIPAALRQAQLDVRNNPEKVGEWTRGLGVTPTAVPSGTPTAGGGKLNTTRLWAAFVASGF